MSALTTKLSVLVTELPSRKEQFLSSIGILACPFLTGIMASTGRAIAEARRRDTAGDTLREVPDESSRFTSSAMIRILSRAVSISAGQS